MPTYPIGQNATTVRDGEVNVANVVKGHVNGSNVSDEAIIVPSGAVDLPTTADATNPASGSTRLVARAGGLYVRTSGGAESGPLGGAVAPLAHAASHQDGGSDELALDGSQITTGKVGSARLGTHPVGGEGTGIDRYLDFLGRDLGCRVTLDPGERAELFGPRVGPQPGPGRYSGYRVRLDMEAHEGAVGDHVARHLHRVGRGDTGAVPAASAPHGAVGSTR